MPLFEPGNRHTFKARSIEDDCETCGERYAHASHYGIGWTRPNERVHPPENCSDCGAPFNNADAPEHGKCPACAA